MIEDVSVRAGAYHDSVTLMQVSRRVAAVDGVSAAQVAMGTELNLEVLARMGFALPDGAGPNDLVVAVRAADAGSLAAATQEVEAALTAGSGPRRQSAGARAATQVVPRTVATAAALAGPATGPGAAEPPVAGLALISVPGEHAFTEAMDALQSGLNVMVFSDNVPVEHEVRLKDEGLARGLLVMGPDCGTAVVAGVGLGFANVLRPGPVGLVAASGTGAQQLACLLDAAGVGVRHILGVGGRDLSAAVAARSTRQALAMLDADPRVELVVVVSKPPDPEVAVGLARYAAGLSTPVQLALLGEGRPNLTQAARAAAEAVGATWQPPHWWLAPQARTGRHLVLRAAFAGGTLCDEAMLVAARQLGPVASNIALPGGRWVDAGRLLAGDVGDGHVMVDFGDDELTRGRPHPMIDSSLRVDWLVAQAAARPAVLLLDVVLGHGAHPDPAAELAPAIEACHAIAAQAGHEVAVVVSLCGSDGDPQGLAGQAARLVAAGACVHRSNAHAAAKAVELLADEVGGGEAALAALGAAALGAER